MEKTLKPNGNQGIAIQELLAAPFVAAANANSMMAKKQTSFLIDTCFDIENNDGFSEERYHPKMITMLMSRNTILPTEKGKENAKPKIAEITTEFQIPLLTLVPFNSLSITDVSVKFDLEIVSQANTTTTSSKKSKGEENFEMKGIVSYDANENKNSQYQKRNSAKLSVQMNAKTIPLPVGLTSILEMYSKNINPTSLDRKPVE